MLKLLCLIFIRNMRFVVVLSFLFTCFLSKTFAQAIKGEVVDVNTGLPIENVSVQNIHDKNGMLSGADGHFFITGNREELIEFRKLGYKIVRIRVPGQIPPYFKIAMTKGDIELPEFELYGHGRSKDYKTDSAKYGEMYKHVLSFPKMSTVDMLRSPFSALSKSNRQKWAFQENYNKFQQEKYIDYAFTDQLITSITGLTGDSLIKYKIRYRPSYEQVRNMTEYNFLLYIRASADRFRKTFSYRRNSG